MIEIIFFLKPLVDVLYQVKALDVLLVVLLFYQSVKYKFVVKKQFINLFIVLLLVLSILSLLRNPSSPAIKVFMKFSTGVIIFLIAQYQKDIKKLFSYGTYFFIPLVILFVLMRLAGRGFQQWGKVMTFTGPYYFKADLAVAVFTAGVFFRKYLFFEYSFWVKALTSLYLFLLMPYFIYISNSRIFIGIYIFFFCYIFFELITYKIKVNIPLIFIGGIVLAISVFNLLPKVFESELFEKSDMLNMDFSLEGLMSNENTQGRNMIWMSILYQFSLGESSQKFLGFNWMKEYEFVSFLLKKGTNAHNSFITLMVSIGYLGLGLFVFVLIYSLTRYLVLLNRFKKKKEITFYIHSSGLFIFLIIIGSLTISSIIYTQWNWYVFYFMGFLFSDQIKQELKKIKEVNLAKRST